MLGDDKVRHQSEGEKKKPPSALFERTKSGGQKHEEQSLRSTVPEPREERVAPNGKKKRP